MKLALGSPLGGRLYGWFRSWTTNVGCETELRIGFQDPAHFSLVLPAVLEGDKA